MIIQNDTSIKCNEGLKIKRITSYDTRYLIWGKSGLVHIFSKTHSQSQIYLVL